jgi:hypothetical protein
MTSEDHSDSDTPETHSHSEPEREAHPYPEDVGPPSGYNPKPFAGTEVPDDPRFNAEKRSDKKSLSEVDLPLEVVSGVGLIRSHVNDYGITVDEGRFMRAVVKAMNRELEGYDLTDSMRAIRDQYEIDERKLIDLGHLKRHTGANGQIYYSVTSSGQKACRTQKKQGIAVGDVGADTPHRVGVELAKRYYESLDEVKFVEPTVRKGGNVADLIVNGHNHSRYAIVEVEGGWITADKYETEGNPGSNHYESIQNDYRLLAQSEGESVWLVRNHEIVGTVLRALRSGDDLGFTFPLDIIKKVENATMNIETLNEEHISPLQDDGIDEIATFKQFRNRLS